MSRGVEFGTCMLTEANMAHIAIGKKTLTRGQNGALNGRTHRIQGLVRRVRWAFQTQKRGYWYANSIRTLLVKNNRAKGVYSPRWCFREGSRELSELTRIVLHVGPEKCGSTSIQHAVLGGIPAIDRSIIGVMLDPRDVLALDVESPAPDTEKRFHDLIGDRIAAHPGKTIVLSHEMMFKMLRVVRNLSTIALRYTDDVRVIAYVRRQSDFLVSSFGQWLFRSPERLAEARSVLEDNGLDPSLFWGTERHLIAAILGGWQLGRQLSGHLYLDWSESVRERAAALAPLGVLLSIGLLPRTGFPRPLIPDFLDRAGITLDADFTSDKAGGRQNQAYPVAVIESVVAAIEAGCVMPGPHEGNDFFAHCLGASGSAPAIDMTFLTPLKDHIDTAFAERNARFSSEMKLPSSYFEPDVRIGTAEIRDRIEAEAARRAAGAPDIARRSQAALAALVQIAWNTFKTRSVYQ